MPDINDLKFWVSLVEASLAFQLAAAALLAIAFAALADALQNHLTPAHQNTPQEHWKGARQPTL
jgi:hypothetical protein